MKKFLFIIAPIILGIAIFAVYKTWASEYVKTIETFVASYDSQVSSPVNPTFTLYIGDNISPVTNPIKSNFFTITGIYTCGGDCSLQAKINSDSGSTKTFKLPATSNPTYMELVFKDRASIINPTTAGSYDYTLNITPSNLTISGLSAHLTTTYQYEPTGCEDGQPTNEKIKTIESHVYNSANQLSGSVDAPFTLYIGDNISGITDPIKSTFFTITGTYTSSAAATLQLQIDSTSSSTEVFNLPDVGGTPTPFEIIYDDTKGIIDHATAGSYSHTLNILPSNMTISGFGSTVAITYQYKPPACGGAYPATGELTSQVFDTNTDGAAYNSIMWRGVLGGPGVDQGKVEFQIASSDNSTGPWGFVGGTLCTSGDWYDPGAPDTPIEIKCAGAYHNNNRYYKYKVKICSANDCSTPGDYTPTVNDVVVSWSP